MSTRRDLLAGMGGVLSSQLVVAPGHAVAQAGGSTAGGAMDLDDPATSLRAYIKLRGSLDNEPVFDVVQGRVYAILPGEPVRPLFRMIGAQRSLYTFRSALEYQATTRYLGWLLDWDSGWPLEQWTNPWSGERCVVPTTRYGPSTVHIQSDRVVPAGADSEAPATGRRPWFVLGEVVHMLDEILLAAPAGPDYPKADLMTFSGRWQDLADAGRSRIPARLGFSAMEPWRDWMQMDRPGMLWWHVAGVKLDGPQDFPPELLALVQAGDAEFLAPGGDT